MAVAMRLDSHQHFWNYQPAEYAWMDGPEKQVLRRDYLPQDLTPLLDQADLDGSIAVQARQTHEESRWLLELADHHPRIHGVVGWVDLQSPAVEEQLNALAAHPKFIGVRHVVQDEPDDDFMLRPAFVNGIAKLRSFDLTYDILIFPKQLPAAIELVRRFPEQPFVLDHIAKPCIKDGRLEPWKQQIQALAQFPNVLCKVSGMVTEADWSAWKPSHFKPYLDLVREAFGEDRLMFGSDWPVCLLAGNYGEVFRLAEQILQGMSAEAKGKFLGGNAARFYGVV